MSIRKVPILVYHHVYPDDAPELLSATHETGAGIIGRADNDPKTNRLCATTAPPDSSIRYLRLVTSSIAMGRSIMQIS